MPLPYYRRLPTLPSHFPEFKGYPHVHNFVAKHLDMQFDDVRGMLKLPLPKFGIPAGCNFAAAAAWCNLIGGISVVLYIGRHLIFTPGIEDSFTFDGELKAISPRSTVALFQAKRVSPFSYIYTDDAENGWSMKFCTFQGNQPLFIPALDGGLLTLV